MTREFLFPLGSLRFWRNLLLCLLALAMLVALGIGAFTLAMVPEFQSTLAITGKLLLLLILLTYLAGLATAVGYFFETMRHGINGNQELPPLRVGRTLAEGLTGGLFASLSTLLPFYLMLFGTGLVAMAVAGLSTALQTHVHDLLGTLTALVGFGGLAALWMGGGTLLFVVILLVSPIMEARYAATGRVSAFLSPRWAMRAVGVAPGAYLLHQAPFALFSVGALVFYFVTFGLGGLLLVPLYPAVILNHAYLTGRYYGTEVQPRIESGQLT